MTMLHHDGYEASFEDDDDAALFHGEVVNLRDVIAFQSRSVDELRPAFADSIDDYVAFCRERGEVPERPYSGQITVRIGPGLHRAVVSAPLRSGVTPDEWISQALARATS